MVKGLVYKVFEKPLNDPKRGPITLYSIKLDGDANYYSTGADKPSVKAGDYVELDPFKNAKGYWNLKQDGIRIIPRETTESTAPAVATVQGRTMSMGKDDYWNRKEARDLENDKARNVGASRNTAIEFVDLLLRAEALPKLPTKMSEKADTMFGYVEHYASMFRGDGTVTVAVTDEPAAPAKADNWE